MSRQKSHKLDDSRSRVLYVIKNEFKSEADFCRNADLSHNWVQYFKKATDPAINDQLLSSLYDLKKVNPLWILKEEGPYKIYFDSTQSIGFASAEDPGVAYEAFGDALNLIDRIEQTAGEVKDVPLPAGIEIQLAELLVRLLKRREGS